MDTNSPEAWFKNLPPVTRSLLVALFTTTALFSMGLMDVNLILLDWSLVTKKYHIWRLFTGGIFLGGFSFSFVMQLYFFTTFGSKLETHQRFTQTPGEYLFFLVVIALLVSVFSLLLAWPRGFPLTGPSIIFALIYYWSRCEPEARMSIWGFEVKGYQVPFALLFMTVLMGGDIWKDVVGLAAGHVYHFLKDIVPVEYKMDILKTPMFVRKLAARWTRGSGPQPPAAPERPAVGRLWVGGGHRLGETMALLRRSPKLRRQFPMPGSNDYIKDWEMYPPSTFGAALQPVDALLRKRPTTGMTLRGSGVHGPESTDVFKHILWNRMKQGRPLRHLPNLAQLQDEAKMNIGFLWFAIGLALVHQPVMAWGERYAAVHDHYPWMQKRVDGTKGKGQYTWFLQ